jgi:hypothetical protein
MPEMKTYTGGCHCGKVRYEVTTDLSRLIECNCSHCGKEGWILTFAPVAQFKLLSGEDAQTEYRFNKHVIAHLFCSTCGIASFSKGKMPDGTETRAVNVRCLDGLDPWSLTPTRMDGKSR